LDIPPKSVLEPTLFSCYSSDDSSYWQRHTMTPSIQPARPTTRHAVPELTLKLEHQSQNHVGYETKQTRNQVKDSTSIYHSKVITTSEHSRQKHSLCATQPGRHNP